jgi:serine/threonine protein kinase
MRQIDGYQIFAELKRGPVTTIFKALDARHGRIVLIKLLSAEATIENNKRLQFFQESKLSERLAHPNLRRMYQSGMNGGEPFLVLEYVEGPTLFELICQHKKLPLDLCLFIAKELAKAVAAVHQNRVLHRDIKPHNIFLSFAGEVKLGDLGLADELVDANSFIAGTPAYMSPEQVLGREITEVSDLFSFGAVLYEMLTGEAAFANRTLSATLHHVANWEPVPISKLRPEVPEEIVATCQKLLAKNPAERYDSAETVIDHVGRLERVYELKTTKYHLAAFLESPETYREITLPSASADIDVDLAPRRRKRISVNWEITAVVSASMFLAGVLFIRGVKEYTENKVRRTDKVSAATAPLHDALLAGDIGYLDLRVDPPATPGVVHIDGDSIATTPLSAPIKLLPGRHKVGLYHPKWGSRDVEVLITVGDTIRQTVKLNDP